jgi:D-alanine-D-alanine ligase
MNDPTRKVRVGIFFGGKSAEHEVALQSAKNVIEAIDRAKYDVTLIAVDKQGQWHHADAAAYLTHENDPKRIQLAAADGQIALVPGEPEQRLMAVGPGHAPPALDVVFPVMHGTYGEDGTMQGLLKLADVAFVGAGVLGSAVGMDKDTTKRLWRDARLPTAKHLAIRSRDREKIDAKSIAVEFGLPCFVKPANTGSSVGVRKAKTVEDIESAIAHAFEFDHKVMVEEFIEGREIECAVLGNENPQASVLGEIIPRHEFYSYEAKYIDEAGADLKIPAVLPEDLSNDIRAMAVRAFEVVECEGMARVDFFVTNDGRVYLNEINTIPGFTKISMYPKLWQATGIGYADLIDRLIQLAIERHARDQKLKTSYEEE